MSIFAFLHNVCFHCKTCKLIITSKLTKRCKCPQKRKFEVFTWASERDQTRSIDEVCIGW